MATKKSKKVEVRKKSVLLSGFSRGEAEALHMCLKRAFPGSRVHCNADNIVAVVPPAYLSVGQMASEVASFYNLQIT